MNTLPSNKLIAATAPLLPVHNCPDLLAHQARDVFALWKAWEEESGQERDTPFWSVVWPGAVSLAGYLLHNPATVTGRKVLDFGCGGGIAGIAAARAGAGRVIANDIDPIALHITNLNAQANGVSVYPDGNNLLENDTDGCYDVILVADMFYTRTQSTQTGDFLKKHLQSGTLVLIADGERPFAPGEGMHVLREEMIPVNRDLEGVKERRVTICQLQNE